MTKSVYSSKQIIHSSIKDRLIFYLDGMIQLSGSTTFSMMNKTKKYKWNVTVIPKGKSQRVKAKLLLDNKKKDFDVDITLRGDKADIEGHQIVDGKKTPVSFKNVDIKKYKPML